MNNKAVGLLFIPALALALTGCLRSDPPIQFYLLTAHSESASPQDRPFMSSIKTVIGLGPVHIPEYLNRPQMVLGVAENQYRLDEQHRWAERLDQNISRTLLLALSSQLDQAHVVRYPWTQRQDIDYQVRIEILELHRNAGGCSRLSAQWALIRQNQTLGATRFDCTLPAPDGDFDALVKAQSECLATLSSEISGTLKQFIANHRETERTAIRQ